MIICTSQVHIERIDTGALFRLTRAIDKPVIDYTNTCYDRRILFEVEYN
jgi:hypothetical protein